MSKYGRELASEVLSTWSYTDESQFLHGKAGKNLADKGYLFGGDVRGIEAYSKDALSERDHGFLMMANIQGAYQTDKFTGVLSVGQVNEFDKGGIRGNFNSREYYALVKFTEEFAIRAGRFVPAYGINFPDHTLMIKEMIGSIPFYQFDSVEASYLGERWTILATAARTTPQTRVGSQESVRTLNVSYAPLDSMRVGASYWSGQGARVDRHMWGLNGILGFSKYFYNLSEVDFKYEAAQNGMSVLSQFGYEVFKGFTPYVQYQQAQDNLRDKATLVNEYELGFHFYPRPHIEISAEWGHLRYDSGPADQAFLLGHYYF